MNACKILFFLFLFFLALGQTTPQVQIHKSLTAADGLISGEIYKIAQDNLGNIWFATPLGASRWNGSSFKNFTTDDGLTSPFVFDVESGFNGEVLLSTFGKGITIYNNGAFDTLDVNDGLNSNFVSNIYKSKSGKIFICTEDAIFEYRKGEVFNWGRKYNFTVTGIINCLETSDSAMYVGTKTGLYRLKNNLSEKYTVADGLINNEITGLAEDYAGNLHIGTKEGINIFNGKVFNQLSFNQFGNDLYVYELISASDSSIYYMSNHGVIRNKKGNVSLLTAEEGLINDHVWSVYEDSGGVLYFGSSGYGVSIYYPDFIKNYAAQQGLRYTDITCIVEDSFNNIIVGTNRGLYIKKESLNKFELLIDEISAERIKTLYSSNSNDIFIGTEKYLYKLIPVNETFYQVQFKKNFGEIYSIFEIDASALSVGTQNGIKHVSAIDLSELNKTNQDYNFIDSRFITSDSTIISNIHGKGVILEKGGITKKLDFGTNLVENQINSICELSNGQIWFGTQQSGIKILTDNKIDNFTGNDELLSVIIYQIIESDNQLIISTPRGVNILEISESDTLIRSLVESDGLINNSINKNALYKDSRKNIWIGTNKGLSVFSPRDIKNRSGIRNLHFTKFEIFEKEFCIGFLQRNPDLKFDQNYLTFYYDCTYLSNKDKIKYYYRLNKDKDWHLTKNNSVRFANLSDGNYEIEIKCSDEWNQWSNLINAGFTIKPVWYATWWFLASLIAGVIMIVALIVSYRYKTLLAVEKLRTKIASDLHDEVGSLLTQISMTTDVISQKVENRQVKEKTGFVREKCGEVIGIMSDVIWAIDSRNDNFQSLIDRIQHTASNFLTQNGIELKFEYKIEESKKTINSDFRQNIFLIVKEALNNAVKHSGCTEFSISIMSVKKNFSIILKDNGKGTGISSSGLGSGIKNMKMRAANIGADINIENENGLQIYLFKEKM